MNENYCERCGQKIDDYEFWLTDFDGETRFCSKRCAENAADYVGEMTGFYCRVTHFKNGMRYLND